MIIVTHDNRLHDIADRILWLEDGALRQLDTLATDPVCHMAVTPGTARRMSSRPHLELDGTVWWFCSTGCRDEFVAAPARFTTPQYRRPMSLAATRTRQHAHSRQPEL